MYAVIQAGGKQYKVAKDDVIEVNRFAAKAGDKLTIKEVIAVGGKEMKFGAPFVAGASVIAEVVEDRRGPKIIIFKKKRRHNYRRKNGHRQDLIAIRITDIKVSGSKEEGASHGA